MEKLEIILNKHKEWHWFLCSLFCLTLLIKMCIISIFLCFALVPKLVPRTVDFHWYWYRILKFWYLDNTSRKSCYFNSVNRIHCYLHLVQRATAYLFAKCGTRKGNKDAPIRNEKHPSTQAHALSGPAESSVVAVLITVTSYVSITLFLCTF